MFMLNVCLIRGLTNGSLEEGVPEEMDEMNLYWINLNVIYDFKSCLFFYSNYCCPTYCGPQS